MARAQKSAEQPEERKTVNLDDAPNPVWFKPVMVGFMLLGLAWIIVFYLTDQQYPIPGLDGWNLIAGFGIAFIGFLMTMRWR